MPVRMAAFELYGFQPWMLPAKALEVEPAGPAPMFAGAPVYVGAEPSTGPKTHESGNCAPILLVPSEHPAPSKE